MDIFTNLIVASARVFGFMVSMPFGDAVSTLPRLFVSILIGGALADCTVGVGQGDGTLVGREFVIGYILGYPFRFVTDIADLIGELLDTARGQTIASILDPLNGPAVSDLAGIFRMGACTIALHYGALTSGCKVLQLSYEMVPPQHSFDMVGMDERTLANCGAVVGTLLSAFITFVGSFLAVDIIAALSSRVCSHLSFATVAQTAKLIALVALGVLSMVFWREELLSFCEGHVYTVSVLVPPKNGMR